MSFSNIHTTLNSIYLRDLSKYTLIIITSILLISACSGDKEEVPVEKEITETVVPESTKATSVDIASEMQVNREKWVSHEISSYQIEIQKICYCVPEVVRMMVFEIDENEITSVRYADTGEDVDPQHYGDFNTIDSMFTFVEKALEKNPADLSIAYHEKYGYIKEMSVDFKKNIADDEISIIASNMRPKEN